MSDPESSRSDSDAPGAPFERSLYSLQIARYFTLKKLHDSSIKPLSATEAQMAAIDNEIAWHNAQIDLLKSKRNSLAPICSLPNELLARIITIYAVDSESLFDLKWTQIMRVCRHWRALGLSVHSLWSFIDLGWRKAYPCLFGQLERSGVAPITLKIGHCDSPYYINIILEHSHRIQALELAGDAGIVHDLVAMLQYHSFPILSSLNLDPREKRDQIPEGFVSALSESVFDRGIPCLRELTLHAINLPWRSLRNLETLSLTQCNDSANDSASAPLQTFDTLLAMLASSPQLRTLQLDRVIPPPLPEQQYDTVDLPALISLRLGGHFDLCTAALNHLRFPLTTRVRIYPSRVHAGADIRELLIPIHQRLHAPSAPTQPLLLIECYDKGPAHHFLISIHQDTAPPAALVYEPSLLTLSSYPRNESALRQIASKIIKATQFTHITHLDLRLGTQPTPRSWKTVLKCLPSLRMVYMQANSGAINFLRALFEIETTDRARQDYPRLRCLHLLAAMWEERNDEIVELLAAMKDFLELSHANGSPLEVLETDERFGCLIKHEAALEELFPFVGEMIRNGRVYDPVKQKEEAAEWLAQCRAEAAAMGIESP